MSKPRIRREQIAGMNIHYVNYSLDYFLDAQQRAGFKSIELWCAAPHVWLDHMHYYDAEQIARKIRARELQVQVLTPENCTYPYQFAAKEPEHAVRSFGYFSNGIRLAEELGCKYMEVNSGWGYWNEDREEAWKRSRDMLARLADVAADHGITLVMESIRPEESQLVITVQDAKRMIDEVGSPHLKAMVDTCAMGVANETLEEWFDCLGSDIRHMHFIDGRPYGHLIWGEGLHPLDEAGELLELRGRFS
jgi:protein FrlC